MQQSSIKIEFCDVAQCKAQVNARSAANDRTAIDNCQSIMAHTDANSQITKAKFEAVYATITSKNNQISVGWSLK